tara:strand:- start:2305 stop:3360 length:1056 start_codon:yes stop_codon:yes gene_type:complete
MSASFAKTVAWVTEVNGNAFVVSEQKAPTSLRLGSQIEDLSKVMVEDGSSLSLINHHGHEFYIPSGTYVKFFNGITELINGHVWVISKEKKYLGEMHTANGTVKFDQGQFILSYDNVTGKTQMMSLIGTHKLANNYEIDLLIDVPAGHFSFVDAEYEHSLPRKPTRVGEKSHSKFKSVFASFDHLRDSDVHEMHWAPKKKKLRSIASVDDQFSLHHKSRGKIIKIKTYKSQRSPASIPSPMQDYSQMRKKKKVANYPVKTKNEAKITFHGFEFKQDVPEVIIKAATLPVTVKRAPASIQKTELIKELSRSPQSVFEESLQEKIQEEKKHPEEVNKLIDELKTFSQDYNKNY